MQGSILRLGGQKIRAKFERTPNTILYRNKFTHEDGAKSVNGRQKR